MSLTSRYERKFCPSESSLEELRAVLLRHPCCFYEQYPERTVNNVYFDTPALDCYHAHVDGLGRRSKYRLRWYGEAAQGPVSPVLEIKRRQGEVGDKLGFPLPGVTDAADLWSGSLDRGIGDGDMPDALSLLAPRLLPVLFNRYRRSYFRSACGRFRLTVDTDLLFSSPGDQASRTPHEGLVVELKYEQAQAAEAVAVAQSFPWRFRRFSKYVTGVAALCA